MVEPMPACSLCPLCDSSYTAALALAMALPRALARSLTPSNLRASGGRLPLLCRKKSSMTSTLILLATSPAACPPMPSQTTKMPYRVSYPKLTSLFLRTEPTSLLPATSIVKLMCSQYFVRTVRAAQALCRGGIGTPDAPCLAGAQRKHSRQCRQSHYGPHAQLLPWAKQISGRLGKFYFSNGENGKTICDLGSST